LQRQAIRIGSSKQLPWEEVGSFLFIFDVFYIDDDLESNITAK